MTSFLSSIVQNLLSQQIDISQLTFVLPSKRAGAFLKKEISLLVDKPIFSPEVISIEEFSEKISGLKTIDSVNSLFEFYSVYRQLTPADKIEDFESFSNWAQTLIHDFNEIDRYLIPPNDIFNYIFQIQDINHWSVQAEKTELVENYLSFWKELPRYYQSLKENLLQRKEGYQGLVYRQASENIDEYAKSNASNYIFIGFNALNNAEQLIIQKMLEHSAKIYWDIDEVHFKDADHDASLFLRNYAQTWPYYKDRPFQYISKNFSEEKNIELVGIPKSIGQTKYVGEILSKLSPEQLNKTAVVLGEESLLLPMISSMPENISALNITMGYPLKYSPFSSFFEKLFEIFKIENDQYYYKDVIAILSNVIFRESCSKNAEKAIEVIRNENLLYLTQNQLLDLFSVENKKIVDLCFPGNKISPSEALDRLLEISISFRTVIQDLEQPLNLEFLYHYHQVFEQLKELASNYPHIQSINSLHHFYKEYSGTKTIDFQGKPFQGLQLMGMLESRVLDFETVILTSVNEGVLPAGKTNNSFIPYELKKTFNLPTYKEKDAIYTYHFYHLLQRAKNVYLIHDTDTDSQMGSEKSRFLVQLEVEKQPLHQLKKSVIVPEVPQINSQLLSIKKTPEILEIIKKQAARGFSPSALTTYIRNPLDFYKQYVLKIKDKEEVEETVAHNTLGTVVHATLETFYNTVIGKVLEVEDLETFKAQTEKEVEVQFANVYSKAPLTLGKNLLIFEVVKRYVLNFLDKEIEDVKAGNEIKILEVESNLTAPIQISALDFPVNIRGNVDRVDLYNGVLRIIDYKTGKVEQNKVEIVDWSDLTTDFDKYSKPFQILAYASMLLHNKSIDTPVEAGVISFKNLKSGFLKFTKKDSPGRGAKKSSIIDTAILENYNKQLENLILEIFDPEIAFNEKEIKAYGNY